MLPEETADLTALEPLADDPLERLAQLRQLVHAARYPYQLCPECGADLTTVDIIAHALGHYPPTIPALLFSQEARAREAVLYTLAGAEPPRRY